MKKIIVLAVVLAALMAMPALAAHTDSGCSTCHAAHGGSGTSTGVPLWAGADPNFTSSDFTMYSSGVDTHASFEDTPTGASTICLSCHDGVSDTWDPTGVAQTKVLSTDLSTMHPISFVYATAISGGDTGLEDPPLDATMLVGAGSDRVECTSCHDPHINVTNALRHDVSDGTLCTKCHSK